MRSSRATIIIDAYSRTRATNRCWSSTCARYVCRSVFFNQPISCVLVYQSREQHYHRCSTVGISAAEDTHVSGLFVFYNGVEEKSYVHVKYNRYLLQFFHLLWYHSHFTKGSGEIVEDRKIKRTNWVTDKRSFTLGFFKGNLFPEEKIHISWNSISNSVENLNTEISCFKFLKFKKKQWSQTSRSLGRGRKMDERFERGYQNGGVNGPRIRKPRGARSDGIIGPAVDTYVSLTSSLRSLRCKNTRAIPLGTRPRVAGRCSARSVTAHAPDDARARFFASSSSSSSFRAEESAEVAPVCAREPPLLSST